MLDVRNIHVRLGKTEILHGIDMQAAKEQFTVIIGPNGSGKTTLLRALTGEIGFEGNVSLNGVDIASARPVELASLRGVLPQSANLSFPFTVHEVVRLGLTTGIQTGADAGSRVDQALAAVDLQGFGGRFYQELSGGEQQRVQLARVLTQVWEPVFEGKPRCLFLDEPISSLDIRHQLQIMQIARRYAEAGGGVIAILHDLNLTAHFADHVVLMSGGRVHASGHPHAVLTPSNLEAVYGCPMAVGTVPAGMDFFVLPLISSSQTA
ncbi:MULTISPECIES: heme ABC transporter ATP-binding protein [Hoeflea]|uniref:Heme ABC transporter ATP-binding protein n=1 Tax=Hoeflea alexandrii TaxID=288436 RepID=A0ABT1CPW6_9HYPH|nr:MULTISPECIES: heme ABC transporter ATP-binding protein [Hoeflea]MCO6408240.1 heme ABC transporter ATP-binding protein [Hoeflea alexandrii]MCY0153451.1 heme ABC transporter ATP-binding protein [Hoeflea alexandrii]VVT13096.1 Hemin import ATP-binding protein HmuV [Hoeflea sp. EC-HK425]|tara:strand:- start:1533 stop:2327 length:795 start_codon:yes stop_codon:yes gene_type:complete